VRLGDEGSGKSDAKALAALTLIEVELGHVRQRADFLRTKSQDLPLTLSKLEREKKRKNR